MSEIVIPHQDPMEEIEQLRRELDVAMIEGQKLQDFTRAMNIKALLEQKIIELKKVFDPWQYQLRDDFAKEYGYKYVGRFNELSNVYVLDRLNNQKLVDRSNRFILDFYGHVYDYSGGYYRVYNNLSPTYVFFNAGGKIILYFNEASTRIGDMCDGYLACNPRVGKPYFLNTESQKLNIQTGLTILQVNDFSQGLAAVQLDWSQSKLPYFDFINIKGEFQNIGVFVAVSKFRDGYCAVSKKDKGGWFIINSEGRDLTDYRRNSYDWIELGRNGMALALKSGNIIHLDNKTDQRKTIFSGKHYINSFSEYYGSFIIHEDNAQTILNSEGEVVAKYSHLLDFREGVFEVLDRQSMVTKFITVDGKEIFK